VPPGRAGPSTARPGGSLAGLGGPGARATLSGAPRPRRRPPATNMYLPFQVTFTGKFKLSRRRAGGPAGGVGRHSGRHRDRRPRARAGPGAWPHDRPYGKLTNRRTDDEIRVLLV
jgi:hypothetical protein